MNPAQNAFGRNLRNSSNGRRNILEKFLAITFVFELFLINCRGSPRSFRQTHSRVKHVVDSSEKGTSASLGAAEKLAAGVIDALAQRGRAYAKSGEDRAHAGERRLFPRRRPSPIPTALLAVGAGYLLSMLLRSQPSRSGGKSADAR